MDGYLGVAPRRDGIPSGEVLHDLGEILDEGLNDWRTGQCPFSVTLRHLFHNHRKPLCSRLSDNTPHVDLASFVVAPYTDLLSISSPWLPTGNFSQSSLAEMPSKFLN
jgi:hypothetical protein